MKKLLLKKILPYAIVFLGIAYGVWPIDAIPDIPLIGWIDDLGILGTAIMIAAKIISRNKSIHEVKDGNDENNDKHDQK